nr:MAG TPA: Putative transferase, nesg, ydcK, Structural Genomics.38A [Caudoviricetes sp.]
MVRLGDCQGIRRRLRLRFRPQTSGRTFRTFKSIKNGKKYELTDEILEVGGRVLHRINALRNFGNIKQGEIGGWIENEDNLSHCGDCWVYGNAIVCGEAVIKSKSDYIVFKNWWSSGRYFTWTRSNDKWRVGCFYGTGEELIKKAYNDSEEKGREYERVVKYVESIKSEIK